MPTGRPDYWYGTALYFEENPADGEVTRGPTSNWAYDHLNDANAHHTPAAGGDIDHGDLQGLADDDHSNYLHLSTIRTITAAHRIQRDGAFLQLAEAGGTRIQLVFDWPSNIAFQVLKVDGAVSLLKIDNNGNLTLPGTVDGIDIAAHDADGSAHHAKYLDAEAVSAMGAKGDANALHHDRYDDAEAVSAMGVKGAGNPLHHDIYTDVEALAIAETIIDDTPGDGDTTHAPSANWAFDHDADATAHHTKPAVFVDRGDPAAVDWDQGDLTEDGTWNDLDLSSIVPAGAIAVLFTMVGIHATAGQYFWMRENGNTNQVNVSRFYATTSGAALAADMIVACDANRVIEYNGQSAFAAIELSVRGWWI